MSTISDWTGKAMHGRQQGWPKVTVRMTGTGQPTSLGGLLAAPMSDEGVATCGRRHRANGCRRSPAWPAALGAAPTAVNRKSSFQPTPLPPGWAGTAVFHFQTGCLQP